MRLKRDVCLQHALYDPRCSTTHCNTASLPTATVTLGIGSENSGSCANAKEKEKKTQIK